LRGKIVIGIAMLSCITNGNLCAQLVDEKTPAEVQPFVNSATGNQWTLNFSDEFEGSVLDASKWNVLESAKSRAPRPDLGINDWWWKSDNVSQANGDLVLRVDKHDYNTMHCGSVNSNNLYETQYGYFEVRMKIADASKGTHTAFWFQGDNMSQVDGTANDGAEIDVFESAWLDDYTKSVVHIDGYGADHQANTIKYSTPDIHDGNYHIWGFHWTESFMDIYYDGAFKVRYANDKWVVRSPEFIWLSNGASFGIAGDYFTNKAVGNLTHAYVDYVRVWKSQSYNTQTELECENLNWTSEATAKVVSHNVASAGKHLKFEAQNPGDEIIFEIPIEQDGHHQVSLQALTWSSFGQYACAIETSAGNWHQMNQTIDLYKAATSLVEQTFDQIELKAGTYKLKFSCVGKNSSSAAYVGSFDKLSIRSTSNVATALDTPGASSVKVYPNPCVGQLQLSGLSRPAEVQVYNVTGALVNKQTAQHQINLSGLNKGYYFLKINNEVFKVRKQ